MEKTYYVYIKASEFKVVYTRRTNDLENIAYQHKHKLDDGFSKRYNTHKLFLYDETNDVTAAIEMEKKIKGWLRKKKDALIEENNPGWKNLAQEWFK